MALGASALYTSEFVIRKSYYGCRLDGHGKFLGQPMNDGAHSSTASRKESKEVA